MRAPRILLIRADDETHRELRRRLERGGCEVFEAGTQPQAVRMAREVEADLLVQEDPLAWTDRPAALDRVMKAVAILAGPLPAHVHRAAAAAPHGWPSPRRKARRPRRRERAGAV
jgi:hypothetical protein